MKVTGLPKRTSAAVTVTGKGLKKKLKRSSTLKRLKPGKYRLKAEPVRVGPDTYRPSPTAKVVKVTKRKGKRVRITYRTVPPVPAPVTPVSGLQVEGRTLTTLTLAWAPVDASIVVRSAEGDAPPPSIEAGTAVPTSGNTATATGLEPNTTYSFSAFAVAGDGRVSQASSLSAQTLGITGISAGGDHTCAVLTTGQIQCWGDNSYGQLGNGTTTPAAEAVTVIGVSDAIEVSAGRQHTCAIRSDRSVACWGNGQDGALGYNSAESSSTPVPVALGADQAFTISSGNAFTCASLLGGRVACWGLGNAGQMGIGVANTTNLVPVKATGVTTASSVSAGSSAVCARLVDGTGRCWGFNDSGQLGVAFPPSNQLTPVQVTGLTDATSIGIGQDHACALVGDGSVRCWGKGTSGQLGDGNNVDSVTPVTAALTGATSLSVGGYSTCATVTGGTVRCWGYNGDGQIGDGSTGDADTPVEVAGLTSATSVSTGFEHACALREKQLPACWGANASGQLGDGGTGNRTVPVAVTILR